MYIILQKSHVVTIAKCLLNIQTRRVACFKGSHPNIFFLSCRLRYMRRAVAHACLFARLKRQRYAKKSTPCLIKKGSSHGVRQIARLKRFLSFTFDITQRSYEKMMCIYLLFDWLSGGNCIVFTFSLHKGRQISTD